MRKQIVALVAAGTIMTGGAATAIATTTLTHPVGSCTSTTYAPTFHPAHTRAAYSYINSKGTLVRVAAKYFQSYTVMAYTKRTCYGR